MLNDSCHNKSHIDPSHTPVPSAIMFAAGIFGNGLALVILELRRRRQAKKDGQKHSALFHILITALVVTDLTGTCLASPIVLVAYAYNTTLIWLSSTTYHNPTLNQTVTVSEPIVCQYFGFTMTFFSLLTLSLLFTTALDRCFAIGYPYLYSRHVTKKWAYIIIPLLFIFSTLFCVLPFFTFGSYVQYCPGTWCFIDMNPESRKDRAYANLYATVMLVLVLTIVVCNGFVVKQLFRMYQRRKRQGSIVTLAKRSNSHRKLVSMAEEVEHLILIFIMTIIFIICTLPLVIRVYMNSLGDNKESHILDLTALRFISINSIIDPWVFILLSPSVVHFFLFSVCHAPFGSSRDSVCKASLVRETELTSTRRPGEDFTSRENI
uniref:Prostaglandin E2 receptor EP2 subtype n=1 Tax=Oryzias latipes TaxID=8090 RepID=A0A3P9JLF9_ORYLA